MRKIFCHHYNMLLIGLEHVVYPGKLGEQIFHHISQKAWGKWLIQQTKLINEHNLNMNNIKHIKLLEQEMISFLFKK
ncbi:oxidative damage protection protein [Enterobacteriaceae endosymbiont of Macroplea mutica]|uniref:oxidative damage protection protein n=1 Tax=Enterobacteriaceae endosymbiont of Macroplea mutica TaxID=2675791 RepID=UPI001449E53C|nr:oxidative damage protection protein [Enterobacteriaceae endosymbiont of Macroplea mutica]QJC31305.1 oxidative damage protection protein [Enterobacteriaceae endosymbiont of Macroplea mutica]